LTDIARNRAMIAGPTRNATRSEVTNAPAARNVM
jgi:hypothetical protein